MLGLSMYICRWILYILYILCDIFIVAYVYIILNLCHIILMIQFIIFKYVTFNA